jgi:hypothetical protein
MNIEALVKLWNLTQIHHGTSGARHAVGVLLGLYNGPRFPFDLTNLRAFDETYLNAALAVIDGDSRRCVREVHEWLNRITGRHDFGARFELLAYNYRLKGRCKKEYVDSLTLDPWNLIIDTKDFPITDDEEKMCAQIRTECEMEKKALQP